MAPPAGDETFSDPAAPKRAPTIEDKPHLVLAIECERPLGGSARYALSDVDEVVIGRGTVRAVKRSLEGRTRRMTVVVPDRRMSTTHGRLSWRGDRWTFEDLGSRNGSLVNGKATKGSAVEDGDFVQLGHTIFLLREDLATPPGTADDVDSSALSGEPLGMRTLVPALTKELRALTRVARSRVSVLLTGETGTGKEVLARSIHQLSGAKGPLIAVNCGAIPDTLVESQLFGHVKGAFSGAVRDELGFVRAADAGTLFLDEIGELPRTAQTALLRVLQEGEVVPVGSTRAIPVDIRLVAATHRSLEQLVAQGEFRADLFARLGGLTFELPPLHERREDLGLLIADLLPRFADIEALEPSAALAMLAYRWPHNIRELEKALSLASVLADGGVVGEAHLPPAVRASLQTLERPPSSDRLASDAAADAPELRATLIAHLERSQGNVTEVARAMGKMRQQIHRWLRRLRIDPKIYRL